MSTQEVSCISEGLHRLDEDVQVEIWKRALAFYQRAAARVHHAKVMRDVPKAAYVIDVSRSFHADHLERGYSDYFETSEFNSTYLRCDEIDWYDCLEDSEGGRYVDYAERRTGESIQNARLIDYKTADDLRRTYLIRHSYPDLKCRGLFHVMPRPGPHLPMNLP